VISFAIVNWNGGNVFRQSISSIIAEAEREQLSYEIVVVDNGSTDDSFEWLDRIPNVRLYRNGSNRMFSKATNQSVRLAKGSTLIILNNDVVLVSGCLEKLIPASNQADAAVPRLINPDGTQQLSIRGIPGLIDVLAEAMGLGAFLSSADRWIKRRFKYDIKQFVEQPMFSAIIMRRETWSQVGDLDTGMPLLFNDVDWFRRFQRLAMKCLYVPDAHAVHFHGMSVNRNRFRRIVSSTVGLTRYFQKDKSPYWMPVVLLVATLTFWGRIVVELLKSVRLVHPRSFYATFHRHRRKASGV